MTPWQPLWGSGHDRGGYSDTNFNGVSGLTPAYRYPNDCTTGSPPNKPKEDNRRSDCEDLVEVAVPRPAPGDHDPGKTISKSCENAGSMRKPSGFVFLHAEDKRRQVRGQRRHRRKCCRCWPHVMALPEAQVVRSRASAPWSAVSGWVMRLIGDSSRDTRRSVDAVGTARAPAIPLFGRAEVLMDTSCTGFACGA